MSETLARQSLMAVVNQLVQDHTDYPLLVEAENRTAVDQAKQVKPYLRVTIDMLSGEQLDVGDAPRRRQYGQLLLEVIVKCGTGTAEMARLRDFVTPRFDIKNIGPVVCRAAELYKSKEHKGWEHYPVLINFHYDTIVA